MVKNPRKAMSLVLTFLILLTSIISVNAQATDVKGHWAADKIIKWYELGLTKGTSDTTFSPDSFSTKAEVVAYLNRIFNFTEKVDTKFSDVPKTSWYSSEIEKSVAAGIIEAKNGKIRPLEQITRQEVAQIIANAFGLETSNIDNLKAFTDADSIQHEYRNAMSALVEKGYIKGRPGKKLAPLSKITRAEVITMIGNAMGELRSTKGSYSRNVNGNMVVNTGDVVLKDMIIGGNLYLTQGIGDGNATLEDVTIKGDVIVSGGGMESIRITNSSINGRLIAAKRDGNVKIVIDGSSDLHSIEEIIISAGGATIEIINGSVGTFIANAAAKVTGKGSISNAYINAAGVNIEQKPKKTIIADGLTAVIGGVVSTGIVTDGPSSPVYIPGGPGTNPGTDPGTDPTKEPGIMFDDFNYESSTDKALNEMGWTVKETTEEGPGPAGCRWSKDNVSFIDDPDNEGNRFVKFTSYTDGTNEGTNQAEIFTTRKFYEGTYAARVKFSDTPLEGEAFDGDEVVQTFFTITPLDYDLDPNYSECDFEYLPNGGWGDTRIMMYQTTWETYQGDPWLAVNISDFKYNESFEGWHDLVLTVKDGRCKYYIDGELVSDHTDQYYPEGPMSINFNQWFVSGGFNESLGDAIRTYEQEIDWVYFAEDKVMTAQQVKAVVAAYRADSVTAFDNIASKDLTDVPQAANLSVDSALNSGNYTVSVTIPANNNAKSLRLYENGNLVLVRPVELNSSDIQTFVYSVEGKPVSTYTYIAELSNLNGTTASEELSVEVAADDFPFNVALNKPSIGSEGPLALNPKAINDGIISDSESAISGVGEGLQWAQIDFGKSYDVNKVNLWHYYADGRTYHDVIVQFSNDETFSEGVTTVFNNDKDNSAGFGIGSDKEYAETAEGKTIHFNTVNARYIRLYTNGLTKPMTDPDNPGQSLPYNHYVEVEVWTAEGE